MTHSIRIVFGKEQVNKYLSDIPFSEEECSINEKEYYFDTKVELDAFVKGINGAVGWLECYVVEPTSSKTSLESEAEVKQQLSVKS